MSVLTVLALSLLSDILIFMCLCLLEKIQNGHKFKTNLAQLCTRMNNIG